MQFLYILPVFARYAIILLLAGVSLAFAAESADSAAVGAIQAEVAQEHVFDIPLPKQSAYTGKGFTVGIGMGVFDPSAECDCMGVWQGQLEYFYAPWLSGGVEVRFFGGEMDSETSLLYRRYRVFGKFHLAFSRFSIYLSPLVGMESTDISEIRRQWENRSNANETLVEDSTESITNNCRKMFSLDGFSAGLEMGMGYAFSRYLGFFTGIQYEHNFSRSQLLTLTPGLGFNLRSVWDWANKNTYSLWLTLEGGGQKYFNRGVSVWSRVLFFGFTLGV